MPRLPTDQRSQTEFETFGARLIVERTPPHGTPRAVSLPRDASFELIAATLQRDLGADPIEAEEVAGEIRRRLGASDTFPCAADEPG